MISSSPDVAQIRLDNALILFNEFVHATIKTPDAATLRGLEGRFAERLQIQPSYWSQIKARTRQIGDRLARQFEPLCDKPTGWMDQPHGAVAGSVPMTPRPKDDDSQRNVPQDDDERFIVGLVLTYYRRHPQRARGRLLDLLGEVLVPAPTSAVVSKPVPPPEDGMKLWNESQAAVAPLKRKR